MVTEWTVKDPRTHPVDAPVPTRCHPSRRGSCLTLESNQALPGLQPGALPRVPMRRVSLPAAALDDRAALTPPGPEAGGLPMVTLAIVVTEGPVLGHRRVDAPATTDAEQSPGSNAPRSGLEPETSGFGDRRSSN